MEAAWALVPHPQTQVGALRRVLVVRCQTVQAVELWVRPSPLLLLPEAVVWASASVVEPRTTDLHVVREALVPDLVQDSAALPPSVRMQVLAMAVHFDQLVVELGVRLHYWREETTLVERQR